MTRTTTTTTQTRQRQMQTINEQARIGSELLVYYVVSKATDIVSFDGWFFVWHNGKSIAAYRTDTEAIAHADTLDNDNDNDNQPTTTRNNAMIAKYPIINNSPRISVGTSFESIVWFVQWRKPQQRSLKRLLRQNGYTKRQSTKIAHSVYIESNRENHVFQTTRGMFSLTFRYCF